MKIKYFIVLLIIPFKLVLPQTEFDFLPENLNISSFKANFLEPRFGFTFSLAGDNIRLDIGNSTDVFHIKNENKIYSLGVDMFTFTKLKGENDFHFPVEAIDFYFGLNGGLKIQNKSSSYGMRLRIAHISAHLADGAYNGSSNEWETERGPFVYSREFVESFFFYSFDQTRVYSGFTYLFHVIPDEIKNTIFQVGFEKYFESIFSEEIFFFVAYDFKLNGIDKYFGNNILTGGIKTGEWDSRGFILALSYYSGKSVHGEFYYLNENFTTLSLNFVL